MQRSFCVGLPRSAIDERAHRSLEIDVSGAAQALTGHMVDDIELRVGVKPFHPQHSHRI